MNSAQISKKNMNNVMREIKIAKLSINTCMAPKGNRLEKAAKVLEQLTGQKPFMSKAKITLRGFGIRRNENIAASVTIKGKKAYELLENALKIKDFELRSSCFSNNGCFGFGINEHIDLNIKYDPACGIFGLNFFVVLERPGNRVSKRKRCAKKIGNNQRISKEDAQNWFKSNLKGGIITEEN